MESNKMITYKEVDGVAYIIFNHAPANAYNINFQNEFNAAVSKADAEANVVIIKSSIDKFFCAGADIKIFDTITIAEKKLMVDTARNTLAKIEASSKIFIAELNGHTLGGGLEIAMACDIRFAGDKNFLIGLPEVKLGLLPGNGGSQRLPRLVGNTKALELLITGDNISPAEAYRIGLVNRLVSPEKLSEETKVFAELLAKGAPLAIAACKKSLQLGSHLELKDGLKIEASLVDDLYETADAKEGFRAFVEKRAPVYNGQ